MRQCALQMNFQELTVILQKNSVTYLLSSVFLRARPAQRIHYENKSAGSTILKEHGRLSQFYELK